MEMATVHNILDLPHGFLLSKRAKIVDKWNKHLSLLSSVGG